MKKSLFLILIIFMSFNLFSQETPSFRLSVTPFFSQSTLNAKLNRSRSFFASIKDEEDRISELGFTVTGSYAFSLFDCHRLSIGLGYSNWNGTLRDDATWGNDPTGVYDFYKYFHVHELAIPIEFWFYSKGEGWRFFAKTGLVPSYLVRSVAEYGIEEPGVGFRKGEMSDEFEKINIAMHLAFGLEKKLNESWSIFFAPNVHGYLLTDKAQFLLHGIRRNGLGLEVGMSYTLREKVVDTLWLI